MKRSIPGPLACSLKWAAFFAPSQFGNWAAVLASFKCCRRPDWRRKPMEQGSVARKKPSPSNLAADLVTLNRLMPEDLSLPSLHDRPSRVQGYAFRFFLVL